MFVTVYEERDCSKCGSGSLRSLGWAPSPDGWPLETVCLWCLTAMLSELHEVDIIPILLNIHGLKQASANLPAPPPTKRTAPKKVRKLRSE